MKVLAKVESPDDIEISMSITMPLGRWVALAEDLSSGKAYVSSDLAREIRIVSLNAKQAFYATEDQRKKSEP